MFVLGFDPCFKVHVRILNTGSMQKPAVVGCKGVSGFKTRLVDGFFPFAVAKA
jgi:hypothetical protein